MPPYLNSTLANHCVSSLLARRDANSVWSYPTSPAQAAKVLKNKNDINLGVIIRRTKKEENGTIVVYKKE